MPRPAENNGNDGDSPGPATGQDGHHLGEHRIPGEPRCRVRWTAGPGPLPERSEKETQKECFETKSAFFIPTEIQNLFFNATEGIKSSNRRDRQKGSVERIALKFSEVAGNRYSKFWPSCSIRAADSPSASRAATSPQRHRPEVHPGKPASTRAGQSPGAFSKCQYRRPSGPGHPTALAGMKPDTSNLTARHFFQNTLWIF